MLRLALLLFVPCLISAEATCPDGATITCPEGQVCCIVNNKQSCCDEAQLPLRSTLLAAVDNSSVQNGLFDNNCNTFTNCRGGTCCSSGCCKAYQLATCCSNNHCCPMMNSCCTAGCCPMLNSCCGAGCCPALTKCCSGGWCCKNSQRCGLSYKTCYNGAGALSPTTLVTLVAAWLVAYAIKKM